MADYGTERGGPLDLSTGQVTDSVTGKTESREVWLTRVASFRQGKLETLKANRDETSDIQNLPGIKPEFIDDWLGMGPQYVQNREYTGE